MRFVEDNWESPTLGAWGLGWEVWLNGMEIGQFTYFQQMGGVECAPVAGEITYGIERLAMSLQQIDNTFDLLWANYDHAKLYYRDLFYQNEKQQSVYNFDKANVSQLKRQFDEKEQECMQLIEKALVLPAYEQAVMASHFFDLLDAMHCGRCLHMEATRSARVAFLCEEYRHFLQNSELFESAISRLTVHVGKKKIAHWLSLHKAKKMTALVEDLLVSHYDPFYTRSTNKHFKHYQNTGTTIQLNGIDEENLNKAIADIKEM